MNIKKLLYESFDRNLSKSEANKLKNALIKSESLKRTKRTFHFQGSNFSKHPKRF